ncbi:ent-kaurenoic acid oxidase [Trifolium repens]|nr:ent-kaurenoic acid oxidase [Trifolium repens]
MKSKKWFIFLSLFRCANIVFSTFREATSDININGYLIPKGWRVMLWSSAIHMDSKYYPNAEEFNPSKWNDYTAKVGTFLPFGAGKVGFVLEQTWLERLNPECRVTCLPVRKPIDNCLAKVIKVSYA